MAVTDSTSQEVADYRAQIEARKAKRTEILDRFVYHAPTHTQATLLAECHNKIMECAEFLVDRLPDGRDRAVAGLFERHYRQIVAYLARRVYSSEQHIVEDLAQETFIRAHRNADRYEDRGISEAHWLYRIAYTVLVDHERRRKSRGEHKVLALEDWLPVVEAIPAPSEQRFDFEPYLMRLTTDQRMVIDLRYLQGYTTRETAAVIGKSEDAVKKLQARALVNLRRMLEMEERKAA